LIVPSASCGQRGTLLKLIYCVVFAWALPLVAAAQTTICPPGFHNVPGEGCRFVVFSVPPPLGDTLLGDERVPAPVGYLIVESDQKNIAQPVSLDEFIQDADAARSLGKAFFWDTQVGSDGMTACATCHHRAGADGRIHDTMHPGADGVFGGPFSGDRTAVGPDEDLSLLSFPTSSLEEVLDRFDQLMERGIAPFFSNISRNVDDIVGSAGVVRREYLGTDPGMPIDASASSPDPIFQSSDGNTRQVTGRNAPTILNSSFYTRQFWDGRANEIFNGVDPFGPANAEARIWVSNPDGVWPARLDMRYSSLASQAVGPPNNHVEMAFGRKGADGKRADARSFQELGRKMLSLRPLAQQEVNLTDSLLGSLRHPSGRGLQVEYRDLIKKAFRSKYWDESAVMGHEFSLIESNFSLFWGLAIQMYENELVSSRLDTRFDRFISQERYFFGNPHSIAKPFVTQSKSIELNAEEKLGMRIFFNDGFSDPMVGAGLCAACHVGSAFSIATHLGMKAVEVEAAPDPGAPVLVELEGPVESMLMQKMGNLAVASFAERPELLPMEVLPMDCTIPTGDPAELCSVAAVWPMKQGPLGRKYEIRENLTGNIIYWSFYPSIVPECGEILIRPLNPTIHTPPPVFGPDGNLIPVVANTVFTDIFDSVKGVCTNAQFEFELRGLPAGNYSLLVDGVEQTRSDGSPLFILMENVRYDLGFYNIGVRPTAEDLGSGARHPSSFTVGELGEPLSYARRLKEGFDVPEMIGRQSLVGFDPNGNPVELVAAADRVVDAGSFKVPSLRNIELTGPYFHNGGKASLEQVVEFYNRGGDFHETNIEDLAPEIVRLGLTMAERRALVAFLKTLTDERVATEKAPFDHPSLPIPGGTEIPAVGSNGLPAECLPDLLALNERLDFTAQTVSFSIDCNANGVADGCDIASGKSEDSNSNGVPDECPQLPACSDGIDQDSDGRADMDDPSCASSMGNTEGPGWCDMDSDQDVDVNDLNLILANFGKPSSGASDHSDQNGDGMVDGVDTFACFFECDNFGCYDEPARCGLMGWEAFLPLAPLTWRRMRRRSRSRR
jgi:cytochrome c peroxidase